MSVLSDQIGATLCPGMRIPEPLELLFSWIEEHKFFIDRKGTRVGFLYSMKTRLEKAPQGERYGGTDVEFFAEGNQYLGRWLGNDHPETLNRVCVFAKTGGDGSMAAFWLDDSGVQHIVHLGSGSGSILTCVLATDAIDFLRLLAIGYDEICWNEYFDKPPNASRALFVHPNVEFQQWVSNTFSVEIPRTAAEVVLHPAEMGDVQSDDPFWQWVEKNAG
jgi:hypothetical protein